ncbi:hypothetical protein Pan153_24250 [Gimesia panareensis]|uniref:Uncharacterized protein n=1 Tax=Gimesia panareensis TaxID=2527978 RepID=A0A518FN57_9PLAN|nr:hypothetical protein [Gimesia panareensis]QDV17770.1 hypothetical protein Pan153_24250 [Gimesia panareensis]
MRTSRGNRDIQIFSTSFLDLLFCSLAAVVLLWVLLQPPERLEQPKIFSSLTVKQSGFFHLATIKVLNDRGDEITSINRLWEEFKKQGTKTSNERGTSDKAEIDKIVTDAAKNGRSIDPDSLIFKETQASNNRLPLYTKSLVKEMCEKANDGFLNSDSTPQLLLDVLDVDESGFAGSVTLLVHADCPQGVLVLTFRKCGSSNHTIVLEELNEATQSKRELAFDLYHSPVKINGNSRTKDLSELLDIKISFGRGRLRTSLITR